MIARWEDVPALLVATVALAALPSKSPWGVMHSPDDISLKTEAARPTTLKYRRNPTRYSLDGSKRWSRSSALNAMRIVLIRDQPGKLEISLPGCHLFSACSSMVQGLCRPTRFNAPHQEARSENGRHRVRAHPLRAGHVTQAGRSGAPTQEIMRRWVAELGHRERLRPRARQQQRDAASVMRPKIS